MAKFGHGFLLGALTTVSAIAGSLYAFKKNVVEPEQNYQSSLEDNKRRANRKSHAAHQG